MSHPLPTSAPGADATTAAILVETLIYWAARPTRPAKKSPIPRRHTGDNTAPVEDARRYYDNLYYSRGTRSSLKHLPQSLGIGRRRTLLVIVEIDVNVATLPLPRLHAFGPLGKRHLRVMTVVASAWTMSTDINEVGGAFPWGWRIVMVG